VPPVSPLDALTGRSLLWISSLEAGLIALVVVLAVAVLWPGGSKASKKASPPLGMEVDSWDGRLSAPAVVWRTIGIMVFLLVVAAGRLGTENELENIAPALVLGAGWPLLVLESISVGRAWRWIDPFDGLARWLGRGREQPSDEASDVRPAIVSAFALGWYLAAYRGWLSPRSVGLALAVYAIVSLAGCLAFGRVAWLSRWDVFGLVFGWMARLPRGLLRTWRPPRSAEAVLGVLAGALVFAAVRRSPLWSGLAASPGTTLYATLAVLASCSLLAVTFWALGRRAAGGEGEGTVAAAIIPALASLVLALSLEANVLTTSLQLLVPLAGDPFGLGWDLLGPAGAGRYPDPFGERGRVMLQGGLVLAGHVAGALVLARRTGPPHRGPAIVALVLLVSISTVAVTTG
jgi:hypothetical protein